jgi:hypothetical protein
MLVPLLLSVENLVSIPDPPLSDGIGNVIYLGSRFYLRLFHPRSSTNKGHQTYYLPQSGITKHTLRLQLEPSTHSGINGCYKAEYWEYRPIELKQRVNPRRQPRVTERLVREEWWHIPKLLCSKGYVDLTRGVGDDVLSKCDGLNAIDSRVLVNGRLCNPDYYSIEAIPYNNAVSPTERALPISHYVVAWHPDGLAFGCHYRLEYQTPIALREVLYRPYS